MLIEVGKGNHVAKTKICDANLDAYVKITIDNAFMIYDIMYIYHIWIVVYIINRRKNADADRIKRCSNYHVDFQGKTVGNLEDSR